MTQRYKTKAELESKVIRVSLADYFLLAEISRRVGISMAEALHLALQRKEQVITVSPAQIPMPVFRVAPAANVIAVDGNRQVTFRIKPKGGIIQ